jgi:colicin import membrane protein
MRSVAELEFALDIIEAARPVDSTLLAAPQGYVPGANPNQLSDAEMEQRRMAALKSAEARRKTGVSEALRIRNQAVVDAAAHKARVDFELQVAGENQKQHIRAELRDPNLSLAEKQALEAELADVYATEQMYNAGKAQQNLQRQQKMRYLQREMDAASRRYDSAAWTNAKAQLDALKLEMDDVEIAGALLKEHQTARKNYLADQERQRKAIAAAERERERALKRFFNELERQRKKREREAEKAKKKAEREAKEGGGGSGLSDYEKAVMSEAEKERVRYYKSRGKPIPYRQTAAYRDRNKKKKKES